MKNLVLVVLVLLGLIAWVLLVRPEREAPGRTPVAESAHEPPREDASLLAPNVPDESASAHETRVPLATDSAHPNTAAAATVEEDTRVFHGRVVDALGGRAIVEARVLTTSSKREVPTAELVPEEIVDEARSDGEGRFTLTLPPALRLGHVLAPGYGEGVFVIDGAHDAPERAETIELLAGAGFEAFVLDAEDQPVEGAELVLVWPGVSVFRGNGMLFAKERARWKTSTDGAGRARLADLPGESELAWNVLDLVSGNSRAGRIALVPGEEQHLEVRLGGGARLFGHVRTPDGARVAGLGLWLARADPGAQLGEGVAKAASDENGRYEIADIPLGSYRLGPAPGEQEFVCRDTRPFLVERALVEYDLELVPGLFLEGRAVGSEKLVGALDFVTAQPLEGEGEALEGSLEDGAFRLGPCAPGEYLVSASGVDTATRVVHASAGASDIELALQDSRTLTLRVEGATESFELVALDLERHWSVFSPGASTLDWTFPFGAQALVATTPDGRVGFLGRLEVNAETPPEVGLRLEPGARCTFVHRARFGTRRLRLRIDGLEFPLAALDGSGDELLAGASRVVLLPPGVLEAELLEGSNVVAHERIRLGLGEKARVVLEPR